MKKITKISLFILILFPFSVAHSQSSVVNQVVSRWNSLGSFKANISISSGNSQGLSGTLSYQKGKIHISLSGGRVIASTGRELVVFNPSTGVAGKQELVPSGGGLGWLLSPAYKVNASGNSAHLVSEGPEQHFSEVRLNWGDDFILRQLSMKSKDRDWLIIKISNIRMVESFPSNLFSYKAPAGSRTVENPLNQRN